MIKIIFSKLTCINNIQDTIIYQWLTDYRNENAHWWKEESSSNSAPTPLFSSCVDGNWHISYPSMLCKNKGKLCWWEEYFPLYDYVTWLLHLFQNPLTWFLTYMLVYAWTWQDLWFLHLLIMMDHSKICNCYN